MTENNAKKYILFPGRHHSLTKFQAEWIKDTLSGKHKEDNGQTIKVDANTVWIFAITSSNHHTTRRNPISINRRVAQVELFGKHENLPVLVASIYDVQSNERFAEQVILSVHTELGITLTPENTLVAVSTDIGNQYRALGFTLGGVEIDGDSSTARPWDLVLNVAQGDGGLFEKEGHPACLEVWGRYKLKEQVCRVFNDAVISSADGALTETRHYESYAEAFQSSAPRKWKEIRDWLVPGRIVDVGSATGELFAEAGKDATFSQSDFIGIEPDRWLYTEAIHRAELGIFGNPNTFFYRRDILDEQTFLPESVDSTITLALTHEIYSYGNKEADLLKLISVIAEHTRANGVWANLDLCASENANDRVWLKLIETDGEDIPLLEGSELLTPEEVATYLSRGSTRARFKQFAYDWPRFSKQDYPVEYKDGGYIGLKLSDAMEFMLHKDYIDNWASELQEIFTYRDFAFWQRELEKVGFHMLPDSRVYRNPWIETVRFNPVAELYNESMGRIQWPTTHMAWAARKGL